MRLVLAAAATMVLLAATPATAHSGAGAQARDHRPEVLGLEPAVAGVRVGLVDDGTRLELDAGSRDVIVVGYEGEPYLRVDAEGVFENRRSPSTYLNRSLDGDAPPPDADADAAPEWRRIGDGPIVRWHDHALHVPPGLRAGRATASDWQRPLLVDGARVFVMGRIVVLPARAVEPWLGLAALAAVVAVVLAMRRWAAAGVLLVLAIVADGARVAGVVLGTPTWLASRWELLMDAVPAALAGWGVGVAGVVLVLRGRRPESAAAALVAAVVLAVSGGVMELDELDRGDLASALPDVLARASIALPLGLGIGIAVAAALELVRGRRQAATLDASTPRTT